MSTQNQVIFGPHTKTKLISATYTKPGQSILTLKTRHFLAAQKNQVNFDPHTKTNSISIYTLKRSHLKAHTKTQSVSIPAFGFRMDNPSILYTA